MKKIEDDDDVNWPRMWRGQWIYSHLDVILDSVVRMLVELYRKRTNMIWRYRSTFLLVVFTRLFS
jgi:hypothetical protein